MERDFIFRCPAVGVNFRLDFPHAVPTIVIPVSIVRAICHRAGGISDEPNGLLFIIVRIEVNLNFIRFNVIVTPDESRDDFIRRAVVAHDSEIECFVIVGDLERCLFSRGFPFVRIPLTKAFVRRRSLPNGIVKNAIEFWRRAFNSDSRSDTVLGGRLGFSKYVAREWCGKKQYH